MIADPVEESGIFFFLRQQSGNFSPLVQQDFQERKNAAFRTGAVFFMIIQNQFSLYLLLLLL